MKTTFRASMYIIIAGICWGTIGIFSRPLSTLGFSAVEITFIRNFVAFIGLGLYTLISNSSLFRISIRDIWMFLGTGILSIVFFNVMYFITIELVTLSMAAILLYTAPFFVMLMSAFFFKELITRKKVFALLIAASGCICTTGIIDGLINGSEMGNVTPVGILTGIASGLGYALYSIFGTFALRKYKSSTVSLYTFGVAALTLAPFCIRPDFIERLQCVRGAGCSLGIGIEATMLPFLLYTAGLKSVKPGVASVMAFVEPMVATIIGVIIYNEEMTFIEAIGSVMIFVAVITLSYNRRSDS